MNLISYYEKKKRKLILDFSRLQNVEENARGGAATRSTISHACSSAKSVVLNAFVSLQALTATNKYVLVTTIGRLNKVDQNVHKETKRRRREKPICLVLSLINSSMCFFRDAN